MAKIRQTKTNFTAGEITRDLLGRPDLRVYDNGALKLRNIFIYPTGGITRRSGLSYIDTAAGEGRLLSFEFNTEQTYLLVVTNNRIDVYAGGVNIQTISAPWTTAQIPQLAWTQSADTLLIVHPDVPPKKLLRNTGGTFSLVDWTFFINNNVVQQPYYKFADSAVTMTPSATTGTVTLTASAAVFESGHANTRYRIGGKEVLVTSIASPTVATATVIQTLSGTTATIDWEEQAFSSVRGYPITVAFHQDRLVIGGSRDMPNRLWFSKSGDLFNFDLGTGLDDESIEFALLSDQVNAIRGIFSGRHLQVFTSGAEYMVTGDPLTPQTVQLNRQTRVGSRTDRYIPPVTVDGATMFVARTGSQLCQFLYTDVEQAYQATDMSLVSRHVVGTPVDQDFDALNRLLFLVRDDGKFATVTIYRIEEVRAWTLHDTQGNVKSVSVVGNEVYLLIERGGDYFIELFDTALHLDSALTGEAGTPSTTWSGLDHLEGKSVSVVADGVVLADHTVTGGIVTLAEPATTVEIGLSYTHIIEPLPAGVFGEGEPVKKVRLVEAVFRLQDTQALTVDTGRGLKDVSLRQLGEEEILDAPPPLVSGDIRVRNLGWHDDLWEPLWRIEQSTPLPFTLLSVSTEININ